MFAIKKVIRIIYLHYPVAGRDSSGKKRPEWFDFEDCFKNLLHTLSLTSIPWSIDILMDGEKSENWIFRYLRSDKVMIHEYPSCGGGSLLIQRIYDFIAASRWSNRDSIYILENDYLHKPGWPEHLVSAIKTFGNDNYFTLYDHPDKYTQRAYKRLTSQVLLASDSYHWRTTPSTCFSFVVSRYLLEKDSDIFLIPKMEDHLLFTMLACAKNRRLLSPIEGLSTHCMEKWMSPGVDWRSLAKISI